MQGPVLVGDVGGTNVRFALGQKTETGLSVSEFRKYPGDDYPDFYAVLEEYLQTLGVPVTGACFALAGPVFEGAVTLTNRPWHIETVRLREEFGLGNVILINDFVGMARAVPEYAAASFGVIFDGRAVPDAPVIVAGPGTGFGVATLVPQANDRWMVFNGEGGHMAFAPRTPFEMEVARVLLRDHGYVSNELVAAGIGLPDLQKAVCAVLSEDYTPMEAEEVQRRAAAGDQLCRAIITIRANTVMSAVGSLVLANGARGGVVLAGGVTEHIIDYLRTAEARAHFYERGIQTGYMSSCPVSYMCEDEAPLIGAAAYYFQHVTG